MLACSTSLVGHGIEGRHVGSSARFPIGIDVSVAGFSTLHYTMDMDPLLLHDFGVSQPLRRQNGYAHLAVTMTHGRCPEA